MWLATLVMFAGSTVRYSVNWAQILTNNTSDQHDVDNFWSLFYGNNREEPSLDIPSLSIVLQYLPIANVSPSPEVMVWRKLYVYLHHAFVHSIC